jgi:ribonuclease Z
MAKLIILGSSNAVASPDHENTHLALVGSNQIVLIDSPGNPLVRLKMLGLPIEQISDLILTHFHPDHVAGVPLLLMDLWLLGRQSRLVIHGLEHTLDRIEQVMELYNWEHWPGFYPISFHRLPEQEMARVVDQGEFQVYASPVHHLIPTIGLRIEFPELRKVMAYSCDTEPCQEVVRLAGGADVLIHEAAGVAKGHSSAQQAGQVAQKAEVNSLYLIHYPTWEIDPQPFISEARATFGGKVTLAEDMMEIEF